MTRKTALITGGSRGIGLGIALELAAEEWNLAISGRKPFNQVKTTMQKLESHGIKVAYYQSDIALTEDRKKLLCQIRKNFGKLNLLVNNAGVAPTERRDILQASQESFDRLININLKGPYFLTRDAANWMIEQKTAERENTTITKKSLFTIINIGSISAQVASPNRGDYCIAKAGVSMASKLWAARLGEYNIPVFEIQPGIIKTDMTESVQEKYDNLINQGLLLQSRWGLPLDVGKAVASLARGDMLYSTGQIIRVDGGLCLQRL